ncbi:MAG TPA: YihY/virulence factor BrkB family protein [Bacteroidales bacterium]|nr:YihY/virulence factor BrkB family protein [Bacteroidales bacterium]HBZ20709.1 YihY/virulence factor BrkB family protein [Bacteroidales bacterium]
MHIKRDYGKLKLTEKLKNLVLPGFDGIPIREVFQFVIRGFRKGVLVTRASSIAFNLLMAVLPATIFLFTLIPFIPIQNFQNELIKLFESIFPANAYHLMETTIIDIVTKKSGGLLLIMFFATIIFSTNGIHAVLHAFVVTSHSFKPRSWVNQRKVSVLLLLIGILMIGAAGMLIIFGKQAVTRLVELEILEKSLVISILIFLKWIVVVLLLFVAISFLYYLAPARRHDFRFITPGSTLATILFIITSLGFSTYVNSFGQYNKLYGWIGTLMVILIWLYLNSIALLIGFELNLSIKEACIADSESSVTGRMKKK